MVFALIFIKPTGEGGYPNQGTLTEGEGSVQLTSSLRKLALKKGKKRIFIIKRASCKLVSTRTSTVLILFLQLLFPTSTDVMSG
jgi:hypothetical protein